MNTMIRTHLSSTRRPWLETPRRVWLATLGAAAVTRRWAGSEAAPMFRSLVRQGEEIESLVLRGVGERVKSSMDRARRLAAGAQQFAGQSMERFVRRSARVANAAAATARGATARGATPRGATHKAGRTGSRAASGAKKGSARATAGRGRRGARRAAA